MSRRVYSVRPSSDRNSSFVRRSFIAVSLRSRGSVRSARLDAGLKHFVLALERGAHARRHPIAAEFGRHATRLAAVQVDTDVVQQCAQQGLAVAPAPDLEAAVDAEPPV